MAVKRKRLGDLLKEADLITESEIETALQSKKEGQKLGDVLLEKGYITEQQLIEVLEVQLDIPRISLYRYPIDPTIINIVDKEFAQRNMVIPINKEGDVLTVAMNDPMDYFAIDDLKISTGFQVTPVIATKDEIIQAINKHYNIKDEDLDVEVSDDPEDAPIVRLMNQILQTGIQLKASDIHMDPQEDKVFVRYRIDGVLRTERSLPKNFQRSLTARVKIMANLNITESRLPQDGRIKTTVDMKPVDLRISTLPTVYGEKIVIRILDLGQAMNGLDDLGFNKVNQKKLMNLIEQPSGLVLITGPTGSGKSSTLYASLNHLNTEDVNIITIEDPVEYQLEGINQVQVNNQVGLTFARGLRSVLRQDPNIVMVGEIRDSETAEIAIRASLTGHLVFSTLHTNSAISTIPRLFDMDIEPYLVVSSVTGIIAQRLVRKICRDCKTAYEPTEMERKHFVKRGIQVQTVYRGQGCNSCQHTGYRGRMAIQELLVIDDEIRKLLMNNHSISDIHHYAFKNGMIFLIDDGLLKVKQGRTTTEEVLRVAKSD
ncbi:type II secretion system protein E [Pontibacillus halophilus JSM 076056 = DSM 19796]|uniref:Type II secretion system protein E n=1 Tax=Pontibacillus halophilus JSM 076056 = DSM 19796 TaxID=1385510 RepID=A0A0A5GQP1_9BACI|nr:ATPase, T2SS/T4P/T4SS family [Pontibacillus halophilus]KGX93475.1 type II secretion system protein E [Pontibacillus halophilus JSM 076056 = DSM 19796]